MPNSAREHLRASNEGSLEELSGRAERRHRVSRVLVVFCAVLFSYGKRPRFTDGKMGRKIAGRVCPPTVGGHSLPAVLRPGFRSPFRDQGPEGGTSSVWGAARLPERGSASVGFVSARGGGQLQQHTRPEHAHAYSLSKSTDVGNSRTKNHMCDVGDPEGRLAGENTEPHSPRSCIRSCFWLGLSCEGRAAASSRPSTSAWMPLRSGQRPVSSRPGQRGLQVPRASNVFPSVGGYCSHPSGCDPKSVGGVGTRGMNGMRSWALQPRGTRLQSFDFALPVTLCEKLDRSRGELSTLKLNFVNSQFEFVRRHAQAFGHQSAVCCSTCSSGMMDSFFYSFAEQSGVFAPLVVCGPSAGQCGSAGNSWRVRALDRAAVLQVDQR